MADPNEVVEPEVVDGVVEPEVVPEVVEPEPTVSGEEEPPGGTDGTAVYARKQHQEAKRLAKQLASEREARIRAEERAKTLTESKVASPEEKIYSAAEVQRAVDQGLITPADATVYLSNITAKETYRKLESERQQKEAEARPIVAAQQEIDQYLTAAPYLSDDNDPRTQKVVDVYNQIRYKFNLPDNLVTKAMAVRESLGPVSNLQKRRTSDALTRDGANFHAVRSGGGNLNDSAVGDAALLAKAPAHFKEHWDKFRTPTKDRIVEIKLHNKRNPKK